jgi:hypothetical protein
VEEHKASCLMDVPLPSLPSARDVAVDDFSELLHSEGDRSHPNGDLLSH